LKRRYRSKGRPVLSGLRPERSIFAGKRYLPLGLVEAGRGCHFRCEFCAVQTVFQSTQTRRPTEEILDELRRLKKPLIFFVDDNITSNLDEAKEFFRRLKPLGIRWVSQASINAAHDEEFLRIIRESGCQGVLIGFESVNKKSLKRMRKSFNTMAGGYETALKNLRHHGIRLYGTFIAGYEDDTPEDLEAALRFATEQKFYIVAFNHLTPFPGTPLYRRLESEGRLIYDRWWLDDRYRYGMVPFRPENMTPAKVEEQCVRARAAFYSYASIMRRSLDFRVNSSNLYMWLQFFGINYMLRREVFQRRSFPLGDEAFRGALVPVEEFLRPAENA
jgi:radical SAM superfamily enzyme YgiQ (UPF0313 family)